MKSRMIVIALLAGLVVLPLAARPGLAGKPEKKPKPPPGEAKPAIACVDPYSGIWVMDADGSNPTLIHEAAQWVWNVSWSPDGKQLGFDDGFDLWVMDVDVVDGVPQGSNATRLHTGTVTHIGWSPLGDKIVYEESVGGDPSELYLIDADGGTPELLYRSPDGRNVGNPTWSPDGTQIAFTEGTGGNGPYIKILDVATGLVDELVTQWSVWPRCLVWARDSDVLAIQERWEDGAEVHTIDIGTGQATYRFKESDWVTWSPDDAKLLYESRGKGKNGGLWTYTLSTGTTEKLSGTGRFPDWRR